MKITGRDWPPLDAEPEPPTPTPISLASAVALVLIGASPLTSLVVWLALPGDQRWALAIWPAGWAIALIVIVLGNYTQQKGPK